jgi:glycosyltransferase involved in cell wall biosynthesis
MPVFNGEIFIRESIDSLLAQSFIDFELIISDDASTDDTGKICREYALKDKRIQYIRQANNIGYQANFPFVVSKANGIYFMWASQDDIWSSNWIEMMVQNADHGIVTFGRMVDFISYPDRTDCKEAHMHLSTNLLLRSIQLVLDVKRRNNLMYGLFPLMYLKNNNRKALQLYANRKDERHFMLAVLQDHFVLYERGAILYKRAYDRDPDKKRDGFSLFFGRFYSYILMPLKSIPSYLLYFTIPTRIDVRFLILLLFPVYLVKLLFNAVSMFYKGLLIYLIKLNKSENRLKC